MPGGGEQEKCSCRDIRSVQQNELFSSFIPEFPDDALQLLFRPVENGVMLFDKEHDTVKAVPVAFHRFQRTLRAPDPKEERINDPADPDNKWCWRLHLSNRQLLDSASFCTAVASLIADSGRKA